IYIMNSDGSNQTEFVRIKSQDGSGCDNNNPMDIFTSLYSASIGNFTSIDWSPDGNTITYGTIDVIIDTETITTTRTIFSKTIGTAPQQILQTIDLYDKTKEQAGPEDQPENSNMTIISQPQFTPDGRIIYRQATISLEYTYDESEERWVDSEAVGTFSSAIKIMNADGSNPQTISSTSGVDMEGYMNMAFALQSPSMQPVEANDTNNNNGNDTTSTSTNVKELINPVTNKAVSLTTPENTNITCGQANKEDNLNTQDNDYQYPVGLIDFCFNTTESNNEVSLIFVTDLTPQQVKARKFNSNDNTYFDVQGTSITSVSYKGQNALKVNYNITDNGDLDLDSTTGKIKDPVGLAITNQLAGELSTTGANSALITAATAVTSAITLYGLRHRKTLYRSKN
ncbi:hypothetical protein KDA11_00835, partial [Candidatus Saccharibacteria bacterium]|nr:hypothetical protein [Candidatus Saccharibacteria bacterium]